MVSCIPFVMSMLIAQHSFHISMTVNFAQMKVGSLPIGTLPGRTPMDSIDMVPKRALLLCLQA